MGMIIAIAIIWVLCSRSTPPAERRRQRTISRTVTLASVLWVLDAIVNADKHQRY